MGDSDSHQVTLPAALHPLLTEAQQSYAVWQAAQDDAFGDDEAFGAQQTMLRALRLFAAGATDAGMNPASVAATLRHKFPDAPMDALFEPEILVHLPKREKAPVAAAPARDSAILSTPLGERYRDAYSVARTIISLGTTVKVLAYVIGGVIALSGILVSLGDSSSGGVGQASVVLAAVVGVTIFILGVLVSAVGQILRATLDTAVNTSPLLSSDDIGKIMSVN